MRAYVPVSDERLLVSLDPAGGALCLVDVADDVLIVTADLWCEGCTVTVLATTPRRSRRAHRAGRRPLALIEHGVGCPAAARVVRVVGAHLESSVPAASSSRCAS